MPKRQNPGENLQDLCVNIERFNPSTDLRENLGFQYFADVIKDEDMQHWNSIGSFNLNSVIVNIVIDNENFKVTNINVILIFVNIKMHIFLLVKLPFFKTIFNQ